MICTMSYSMNSNLLISVKAFMHDPNQHSKVVYDPDDFLNYNK